MDVTLRILEGEPRTVLVDASTFVIGRAGDCNLTLRSPLVSRYHCELTTHEDHVCVRDLRSSNGTGLNNAILLGERQLHDGDTLWVGVTAVEVHIHRRRPVAAKVGRLFRKFTQPIPAITGTEASRDVALPT